MSSSDSDEDESWDTPDASGNEGVSSLHRANLSTVSRSARRESVIKRGDEVKTPYPNISSCALTASRSRVMRVGSVLCSESRPLALRTSASSIDEDSNNKGAVQQTTDVTQSIIDGVKCNAPQSAEDEDWDKDFGVDASQRHMKLTESHAAASTVGKRDDGAEDWGDFFVGSAGKLSPRKTGAADVSEKDKSCDDWDMEFGIESSGEQKPLSLTLDSSANCLAKSRGCDQRSGSQQQAGPSESQSFRESTRQYRKGSTGASAVDGESGDAVPTITGIKANPMQTESDWDDDFAFGNGSFSVSTLSPAKNSSPTQSALDSAILRMSDVSKEQTARSSGFGESRDITEARFLLQSIPDVSAVSSGARDVVPVWSRCDSKHVFPSWFSQKQSVSPEECKAIMQKAAGLWKQAVSLSSQNLQSAFALSRQILALFDDYSNLSPVEVSFLCLVSLHTALFAKQMADIFKETESLRKGIEIATSESVLTLEPYASDKTLASVRAALYYESTRAAISTGLDPPLPFALKFLRAVIMAPGKNEPSTAPVWSSVARACCLIARSLPKGSHVQEKYEKKAWAIATALGNDAFQKDVAAFLSGVTPKSPSASPMTIRRCAAPTVSPQAQTHQQQQQQSKSLKNLATSVKDSDTTDTASEVDEDWDAEFGIDIERAPALSDKLFSFSPEQQLKQDAVSSPPQTRQDSVTISQQGTQGQQVYGLPSTGFSSIVPSRYKVIEQALANAVNIVRFPPPSHFFSIRTASGYNFLHAETLESWLDQIVSKHQEAGHLFPVPSPGTDIGALLQSAEDRYQHDVSTLQRNCAAYFSRTVNYARELFALGDKESCWNVVYDMFCVDVQAFVDSQKQKETRSKTRKSLRRDVHNICCYALVHFSGLWDISRQEQWKKIFSVCRALHPSYASVITVIENNFYAERYISGSDDEIELWESQNFYPHPFVKLAQVYTSAKARNSREDERHGLRKSHGPLTGLVSALCSLQLSSFCMGPQLLTANEEYPEEDELTEEFVQRPEIATIEMRDQALRKLYPQLPPSIVKAKAAFVLAQQSISSAHWDEAEQLLFESLYILDELSSGNAFATLPLIDTALGLQVLVRFGDVLLHNNKYQFALPCYKAAVLLCGISERKEYFKLVRTVAEVARENDDYDCCLELYNELVEKYLANKKVNEALYVLLIIAQIYEERGDFSDAKRSLVQALSYISPQTSDSTGFSTVTKSMEFSVVANPDPTNPQVSSIRFKLAQLLLNSFSFESGIELLDVLDSPCTPERIRSNVLFSLATAYAKKGWLGSSQKCFKSLARLMHNPNAMCEPPLFLTPDGNKNPSNTAVSSKVFDVCKFFVSLAKSYAANEKHVEALKILDFASELCPNTLLMTRGTILLRRGNSLQALYSKAEAFEFPTAFYDETVVPELSGFLASFRVEAQVRPTVFMRDTDLIQEAANCYRDAYGYFLTLGNDAWIARTMASLAELYLSRIFVRCALFRVPLEDCASFPVFPAPQQQKDGTPSVCTIALAAIENPARVALDIASETVNVDLLPRCLMNMAEVYYLAGEKDASLSYWKECRDIIWAMYMDGPVLMMRSAPLFFLSSVFSVIQRLARLLLCFGSEMIIKNITVLDAFLLAQIDLQQAKERPLQRCCFNSDVATSPQPSPRENDPRAGGKGAPVNPVVLRASSKSPSVTTPSSPCSPAAALQRSDVVKASTPNSVLPPLPYQPGVSAQTRDGKSEEDPAKTEEQKDDEELTTRPAQGNHPGYEEAGEEIWGLLHFMKTNLKKFYCGRLKKDELVSRNTALLREISSTAKRYRCFVVPSVPQVYASTAAGSQKQSSCVCGLPASVYATLYGSYTFDSFNAAYSSVSGRTVYILLLGKVVAYYAPATGKLHFEFLDYMPHLVPARGCPQQGACARHSAEPSGASDSGGSAAPKDSPVLVRVHMLQKPDEYVFMLVSRECTIGDLLDEICHTAADHGATHLQASAQARSAPASTSSGAGSTDSAGSSGSTPALSALGPIPLRGARAVFTSSGNMQLAQQQRVKFVSATSSFWRELGKLGNKVQSETTRSRITSSGHRRSLSYQFRLNGSQLALARVAPAAGAQEPGELRFLQIARPRATRVLNCFAQADVDRVCAPRAAAGGAGAAGDCPCPSLYLYGAVARADDVTCSLAPKTLSPGAVAFLVSLLGPGSGDRAGPGAPPAAAPLCELRALFQGLRDLLPVAIEGAPDPTRSQKPRDERVPPRPAAPGTPAAPPHVLPPATPRGGRFSSLRGLFGLAKDHRSSGNGSGNSSGSGSGSGSGGSSGSGSGSSGVQTVARSPVVLLVSQPLQVVSWEAVLAEHVVLRYWSFFDLVRSAGAAQDAAQAAAVEPAYTAFFCRAADERAAAAREHARLAYQRGCVAAQLRAAAAPPEMARACAAACCAPSPLVDAARRGAAVPRRRHRGVDFFDLGALREQPPLLWEHVAVRGTTFPALVVTYADLADPPALLTALLRQRPCAAVLGVPRAATRAVVQRLCAQQEVVAKQYHRPVPPSVAQQQQQPGASVPDDAVPRDRYQFLLSVVAAAQAESPVPIAVLNAPPPLPSLCPASSVRT